MIESTSLVHKKQVKLNHYQFAIRPFFNNLLRIHSQYRVEFYTSDQRARLT